MEVTQSYSNVNVCIQFSVQAVIQSDRPIFWYIDMKIRQYL